LFTNLTLYSHHASFSACYAVILEALLYLLSVTAGNADVLLEVAHAFPQINAFHYQQKEIS